MSEASIPAAANAGPSRRRRLAIVAGVVGFLGSGLLLAHWGEIRGLWRFATVLREDRLVENFRRMDQLFPARRVARSGPVFELPRRPVTLPGHFTYAGGLHSLDEFLARRVTTGLLVIEDDAIVAERYYLGADEQSRMISWSVGKSFVSALFGIALGEGAIRSLDDRVRDYVPELASSGYADVALRHVLQMSSGIRFREDYGDLSSDINRMGIALALGRPLIDFVASLRNELPPGSYNRYVSMDTQVLGLVLQRATGRSLSSYLEEKLWSRIGVESDAYWLLDDAGFEWAFGGLNVTLRDYGRFGRLYLRGGDWEGEQVIPADWVRASLTPDAPHLMPGKNPASDSSFGYGYQWWLPHQPGDPVPTSASELTGEFMAIGVYGQYIYVDPRAGLVIVKTSADPHFQDNDYESDLETLAAFRAIAQRLAEP